MNSVVMVVIALSIVMIAYGVIINIEAIAHRKNMNPRAMFIIMAILAIVNAKIAKIRSLNDG